MAADPERIAQAIQDWMTGYCEDIDSEDIEVVEMAFDELRTTDCYFDEKEAFYHSVFVEGKTLMAAADEHFISYSTAKRWKRQIIDLIEWGLPD